MKKAIWIGFAVLVSSVNGMIFACEEEKKEEKQEVAVVENSTEECQACPHISKDEKSETFTE